MRVGDREANELGSLPMDDFYCDNEFFSFQRDFTAAMPPLADERELVDTLARYLCEVESIVGDLERVFC